MLRGKGLLTPLQTAFLAAFTTLPDQAHFYLTGGTALAEFYLGHRLSFDLDLFTTEEALIRPVSYQIEAVAPRHGLQVAITRRFSTFVELLVSRGQEQVRIDLTLDSPFRFEPPLQAEIGLAVNDYRDLSVDKLLAYYGRTEPRDAVDLYFILQRESPDSLCQLAARKDPGFDLYWFAVALNKAATFPDELERWPVKMLIPFEPVALKREFQDWALALMSRIMGDEA
ncbi:MAG: nucleotidyl transferase AbiEii/AbiGii toxin family protein [Anaerolineae bacterium]|nr:nucleotidyl transferase AbiEii/AbiGii toxin family protein [Anaerolineae bacterium]MDH7473018.1 nucleotidyl transferase AbiEii/AbiGii toxin family protein [Anaerolineae bacterium]